MKEYKDTDKLGLTAINENRDLTQCVINYESSGNEKAYNPKDTDLREKFGLVQFGEEEFQYWCVDKYSLENNIWNGEIQKQCFIKMIEDGQSFRWPSFKKCLK